MHQLTALDTKGGESTCNDAEKDHEDDACRKGGHVVEGKIVVVIGS